MPSVPPSAPSQAARTSASQPATRTVADLAALLLNPTERAIDRDDPDGLDGELAEQDAADAATSVRLRSQHAALRHQPGQARRVLARLIATETRRRDRRHAAAVPRATVPALLVQVIDAVESSSGQGSRTRSHAHRSPIGLAAAQLVGDIERVVGRGPRDELVRRCWGWVATVSTADGTGHRLAGWVARAQAVVDPPRPLALVAACPACGRRVALVHDDAGELVRRPALQVDRTSGTARCIAPGCPATWGPGALTLLARVLEQQGTGERGTERVGVALVISGGPVCPAT